MLLLMPYFDESNRGPVAVGGLDPRFRHVHALWIWFAIGLTLVALFPALRGGTTFGASAPFWLVAAPLIDLAWLRLARSSRARAWLAGAPLLAPRSAVGTLGTHAVRILPRRSSPWRRAACAPSGAGTRP